MILCTLQTIRGTYHTAAESSHEEAFEYTYYRWSCRQVGHRIVGISNSIKSAFKLKRMIESFAHPPTQKIK